MARFSTDDLINVEQTNDKQGKNTSKLLNFFNIAPTKKGGIIPTQKVLDKKGNETDKITPIDMPSAMESAYQYIVSNLNTAPYMDNAFRFLRYKDMKSACTTEPILDTAVKIYVSEAYATEHGKNLVQIKAKDSKVEKYFYDWYERVGFTENVIRDIFTNLVIYGDAFWINGIDMNGQGGIKTITTIDPFLVADRIEFNVGMVEEKKQWYNQALNLSNSYPALKQIFDIVTNKNLEDISMLYKSFLFGYSLKLSAEEDSGDASAKINGVPPWALTHCRLFTTDKDFFPFGKPMMLSALPTYKSYKTTQLLIDLLRSASFPREKYEIKCDENSDPFTRNMRISEAKNFLENITPQTKNQDGLSVGSKIYTCEGLVDFDIIDPSIDLEALGDLEKKEKSMVMSTGIPDSYILPSEGAGDLGGENADSLYYLNKIFQRRVDALRQAFLEGLDECFRMDLMLTEQFDGDKTEFEFSIDNPVEDYTSDKISQISDIFSLAKDIIDTISTCAGLERGEVVDRSILRDICKMYLPVETTVLDKWINKIYDTAEDETSVEDEENGTSENVLGKKGNLFERKDKSIIEKINNSMDKISEEYFKFKKEHGMTEGKIGNKLYYNNTYRLKEHYEYTTLALAKEQMNINKVKRLKEQQEN